METCKIIFGQRPLKYLVDDQGQPSLSENSWKVIEFADRNQNFKYYKSN